VCSKLLAKARKGSLLSVNKLLIVFGFINLLLNITITVSIIKQNLLYRKRVFYIFLNEFAFKFKYNCKYCSTKSSLQNLQENGVTSF
jgi:hypothetical protein